MPSSSSTKTVRLTVIAADGLVKKDLFFKLPDPFGKKIQKKIKNKKWTLTQQYMQLW
jgi:hypothetical protein